MDTTKVKCLAKQIRGVSYKPKDLHDSLDDNSVILLRANNIDDGKIDFDDVVYVDKSKVSDEQYLKEGDVLICTSSGSKKLVGKAASVNFDLQCTFGAFCKVVRPHTDVADYLGIYFQSDTYRRQISEVALGANINNIRNEHIDCLELPVYDFEQSQGIVKKIRLLQNIMDNRKDELSKLDELIKSRFVELFGDPVINPMSWERVRLADKCEIVTGNTPSRKVKEYYGTDIEWIKSDNITEATNLTTATEYLSDEGAKVGRIVEAGSILMTCIAGSLRSIGNVAIADRAVAFNQQINAILPNEQSTYFMYEQFRLSKEYICSGVNMALKGILSKGQLSEIEFIFPPVELQNQFDEFVALTDKSKNAVQQSIETLQTLKAKLMQDYFG